MANAVNTMPYNRDAEMALLGCLLIDNEIAAELVEKLSEEDFYQESHQHIIRAMKRVFAGRKPVDLVTVSDELESERTLEKAGGIEYITDLARITPSAANYEHYLNIVKRDSTLRRLIRSAEEIIKDCKNSIDYNRSVSFAEKSIYDISEELDSSTLTNINVSFNGILDKFENIQKDKNYLQGLKTGFTGLDNLTNGFKPGNLIILAARPSIGKSTLAMNIVENVAIRENAVCAVFALEMTNAELAQRVLCSVSSVSNQDALKGKLGDEDWHKLWDAKKILDPTNIFVDDTSMTTCPEILSKCRRLKSRLGRLDLIVVDHIQLMNAVKSSDSRQQEVSEISRGLKMIAKELDVPVLALSQLSRLVTGRKGQKPVLSDLRESGAIEQDADIVMFIHRPDKAAEDKEIEQGKVKKNVAEIILAKNRAGACETFELIFQGEKSKFINPPPGFAEYIDIPSTKAERQARKDNEDSDDDGYVPPEPPPEEDDIF